MLVKKSQLSIEDYVQGILSGQRELLARAITLIESSNSEHQKMALEVLERIMPHTGDSLRIGISGIPGVGKSTFIEAFALSLCDQDFKVAVLTIDPSSERTGGSILGDKTRMVELAVHNNAFIRPSPSSGNLGGVARRTRESILLSEAAGYNLIFVETVGVGQSETTVASMVDFFLVLMLAGTGDELQGIKKGIIEIADMLVINKADGDQAKKAQIAAKETMHALSIVSSEFTAWRTPVLTCSALEKTGLDEIWGKLELFQAKMFENGLFKQRRQKQQLQWMWTLIEQEIIHSIKNNPNILDILGKIEKKVSSGELPVRKAVSLLLDKSAINLSQY